MWPDFYFTKFLIKSAKKNKQKTKKGIMNKARIA